MLVGIGIVFGSGRETSVTGHFYGCVLIENYSQIIRERKETSPQMPYALSAEQRRKQLSKLSETAMLIMMYEKCFFSLHSGLIFSRVI